MKRSPVYLRWVDSANLFGDRWAREEDLDGNDGVTYCETLGWIVRENDHSVFIASSLTPTEIGSVMQIPKPMIKQRRLVDWSGRAG